jgi:hypothetical protein
MVHLIYQVPLLLRGSMGRPLIVRSTASSPNYRLIIPQMSRTPAGSPLFTPRPPSLSCLRPQDTVSHVFPQVPIVLGIFR